MRAEVVAVGSELLLGDQVDTNSAWISARLAEIGVDVLRHTSVGDNVDRMVDVLRGAVGRVDAVILTGGLGPTQDDLTRVAVARLAGVQLRRRDELVEYLVRHYERLQREMPARNLVQADLPETATVLAPVGTAAGFAIDVDGTGVWCVPGVPWEMEAMVTRDVVPALQARGGLGATVSRVVRTAGLGESAVAEVVAPVVERLDAQSGETERVTVAFLASAGEARVRITAKSTDRDAALALLAPVVDEIVERLGDNVVGLDDESAAHAVARLLTRRGWTLAVAESVSGGGLGSRLVRVPGASEWFRGGVVVYGTQTKVTLADVDPDVLEREGPVSQAVAGQLAAGAARRLEADVGVGVVGVAGPTAQGGREVGTVCLGVALPGREVQVRELQVPGRSRGHVQDWAANAALDMLRRALAAGS